MGAEHLRHHYWHRLKRQYAFQYDIDPDLSDTLFLNELKPWLDEDDLLALIMLNARLQVPSEDNTNLQEWVEAVLAW